MEYLDFTLKLAKKAGKILLKESQEIIVTEKTTNDFVTNADLAAEKAIIKAINKKYPDHAVLAEESANEELAESDYLWIIDPLDGTNNYAHRIPFYAVSIGLLEIKQQETSKNYQYRSGEIICGAIYIHSRRNVLRSQRHRLFPKSRTPKTTKTPRLQHSPTRQRHDCHRLPANSQRTQPSPIQQHHPQFPSHPPPRLSRYRPSLPRCRTHRPLLGIRPPPLGHCSR